MKFWFCEKCGTRLTDDDLGTGRATEIGSQVVYCAACLRAKAVLESGEHRKTAARATTVVAAAARRTTAVLPRQSGRPEQNMMPYMLGGGGAIVLLLGIVVMSGRKTDSGETLARAEREDPKPVVTSTRSATPPAAPSPAVVAPPADSTRRGESQGNLFSITFGGEKPGASKSPAPPTPPPQNPQKNTPPGNSKPAPAAPATPANPAEPSEELNALMQRAVALEQAGKFDEAIACYDKCVRQSPEFAEIYSNRANARLNKGDFRGALADANTALQKKKFWNAWAVKAIAFAALGQETDYQAALMEALALAPQKKEIEAIIVASAKNVRLISSGKGLEGKQPKSAEEFIARAQFRIKQKRWREALSDYDAALGLDKSLGEKGAYATMGELAGQDGDHKGKLEYYQRWLNAAPLSAEAMNGVAWELLTSKDESLRNPAVALPLAEKANNATQQSNAGILDTYALALHKTGRKAEAITTQKKALALLPKETPAAVRHEFEQHLREFSN